MGDGFVFIEIVIFAMIAAFLVYRLRSVLGRRTGEERQRPNPFTLTPTPVPASGYAASRRFLLKVVSTIMRDALTSGQRKTSGIPQTRSQESEVRSQE